MSAMVGAPAGLEEDEQGQLSFNPKKALIGLLAGAAGKKAAGKTKWLGRRIAQKWEDNYAQPLIDLAKRTIDGRIVNENIRQAFGMNRSKKFKDMFRDFKREEQQIWVRAKEIAEELQELAPTSLEQKRMMQIVKGGVTVSPKLAAKAQEVNRLFSELKDQLKQHELLQYSRFDKATDEVGGMNRKERAKIRKMLTGPDPQTMKIGDLEAHATKLGLDPHAIIKENYRVRGDIEKKHGKTLQTEKDKDVLVKAVQKHLDFHRSRLNDYYHSGSAHEYAPVFYDVHEGLTPKQRKVLDDEIKALKKRSRLGTPEGTQSLEETIAELEQMLRKGTEGRRAYRMTRQGLVKGYAHRRIDMPLRVQRIMGLMEEAAFPVGKALGVQGSDIMKAKLFEAIAAEGDWAYKAQKGVEMPKNYRLVEDEKFGALNGMYVRKDIWDDLREVEEFRNAFVQQWDKYQGIWKSWHVVWNPATQARNTYWNFIAARLADVPFSDVAKIGAGKGVYFKAGQALKQGKENKFYQEADKWGLFNNTFYSQELNKMRDGLESVRDGNGMKNWFRKAIDLPGQAYQGNEKFFKMAVFIKAREDGLDVDAAARKAEEYLFNYGDIPPIVKHVKRWGIPFLTFTWKAMPLIAKTTIRKPHMMLALIAGAYGLEEFGRKQMGMSKEEAEKERKLLPPWQQTKTLGVGPFLHILMPFADKWGNNLYWDTSNILPYADPGDEFGQSGIPGRSFIPAQNPFISLLYAIGANRDSFTGKDIYDKTMYDAMRETEGLALEAIKQKTEKQLAYVWKSMGPPIAPGGYNWSKLKTGLLNTLNKEAKVLDWNDRPYELGSAILSGLLGIKLSPTDDKKLRESELYNINRINRSFSSQKGKLKGQLERNEITKDQYKRGYMQLTEWQKTILKSRQEVLK